jgi:hypothetical protein
MTFNQLKFGERVNPVRNIYRPYATIVAGFGLLMTTACSPAGGSGGGGLPAGETDLSCAGLIYAASRLVDDKVVADTDGTIKSNYLMKMTSYGTAYAKANGITDGMEAFNKSKLEGMKYAGIISSNERIANDEIVTRAKACIAA